jgi:hypothetical protein
MPETGRSLGERLGESNWERDEEAELGLALISPGFELAGSIASPSRSGALGIPLEG